MIQIEKRLREEAKRLLETKEAAVVLAFGRGFDEEHPMPLILRKPSDAEKIVFNEYCTFNMARHLTEFPPGTKIAVAVKAADSRAVTVLIQEGKVKREDLIILGIPVAGMKDFRSGTAIDATTTGPAVNPVLYDILLADLLPEPKDVSPYDVLAEIEAMSPDDRWGFWSAEFSRCIRCYACRKACPLCYCETCFVDQAKPRWSEKSPSASSNMMFHLTRFYHLAGRCIDCGSCSRACPMDIPLYLFHKKVSKECEEMFDQAAGMCVDAKPVMVDFKVEDSDDILL
ncbi:MAG: 4Fe-4S dicluster domain-containing protein [Deltaproteobacteria bacterium]|nr:4Fe-4S dicluster domain-containing protein [Deltaproteobacteria bacterium]